MANAIHICFEDLHKILEKHKHELLEDAMGIVGEKKEKLSLQEKNLPLANAEVQSVGDYAKQSLRHCADCEVMSMHAKITSLIERGIE